MGEAINSLVTAIESGRTDIVRSVVSAFENNEVGTDSDNSLDQLLNSSLTPSGTILHLASQLGQTDIVRALLAAGSDPGIHNEAGQTALDLAATQKVRDVFSQELLQCVAHSDIGRVCQLIASGVDVNVSDSPTSGNSPLHWAASYGNRDVVQCLCKRGAGVNATNLAGATPLHDAVDRGDIQVTEELIKAGAQLDIAAQSGPFAKRTPQDLAKEKPEILKVFQTYQNYQLVNGFLEDSVSEPGDGNGTTTKTARQPSIDSAIVTSPLLPNGGNSSSNLNASFASDFQQTIGEETTSMTSSVTASPSPITTDSRLHYLWPRPAKLIQREGRNFQPKETLVVFMTPSPDSGLSTQKTIQMWQTVKASLGDRLSYNLQIETAVHGYSSNTTTAATTTMASQPHVLCEVNRRLFSRDESYRLSVKHNQVKLVASDRAGLYCGTYTLLQLLMCCGEDGIPPLQIHDHPALPHRAVLLDMSKGRIPTVNSLKAMIRTLACLKINQIQLYFRFHVPANSEFLWQFPYSNGVLLEMAQFCYDHCIELQPVLDVIPKVTYDDLSDLYVTFQAYLSCFPFTSIVGIGPRLSSLLVDVSEEDCSISPQRHLPVMPNQTLQLCAYVFHDSPEALDNFPPNIMVAEYGFQANYDFDKHCRQYAEAGVPFCVVPGTAAWNSLAGCPEAAVTNIYSAVQTALSHGALGMLVSHWSGVGHMTHQSLCWPGLITAAGLAWNPEVHWDFLHGNLSELINRHVLQDLAGSTGQVIIELGRAETYLLKCASAQPGTDNSGLPAERGSTLYQLLSQPDKVALENLSVETFQKAMRHVRKCQSELLKAQLRCPDGQHMVSELQLTADLMLSACRVGRALVFAGKNPSSTAGYSVVNLGVSNLTATNKTDLANRLLSQVDTYRNVWLSRNLPVGLQDSLLLLSQMLRQFVPEQNTE